MNGSSGKPGPARRRLARSEVVSCFKPGKGLAILLVVSLVSTTSLPLLAPQFTRQFVDAASAGASNGRLALLALGFVVVAILGQGSVAWTSLLASRAAWEGSGRLRDKAAEHALELDLTYHNGHPPGQIIERVDGDVTSISDFALSLVLDVVVSALLLVGVVVVVFGIDVRTGVVLLVYCLLTGVALIRLQSLAVPSAVRTRSASALLFGRIEESLTSAEDIRAAGAGGHSLKQFHDATAHLYRAGLRSSRVGSGLVATTSVLLAVGTVLVVGAAWVAHREGAVTLGQTVVLLQYVQIVSTPFERLINQLKQMQDAAGAVARITDLFVEQRMQRPATVGTLLPPGPLAVRIRHLNFSYPGHPEDTALEDIDLMLHPGQVLGVVGRSGSGKTTLGRLLLRFYSPTSGHVEYNDIELAEIGEDELRSRVALVTQDVQIFDASVRDNMTLFRSGHDDSALTGRLTELGLGPWLAALPEGLDTELGNSGASLSAGEAQLLALARAFVGDPGLVILDEASSRLDALAERDLADALTRLLRGRTAVVIAHRLDALDQADMILVVEAGRAVELGGRVELAADPHSRFGQLLDDAGIAR